MLPIVHTNRIDYILVSQDLLPTVKKSAHYCFHEFLQNTDHCGIYMTLKASDLFDAAEMDPTRLEQRRLLLHNRAVVKNILSY